MTPEQQAQGIVDSVLANFGLDADHPGYGITQEDFSEMRAYTIRSIANALRLTSAEPCGDHE